MTHCRTVAARVTHSSDSAPHNRYLVAMARILSTEEIEELEKAAPAWEHRTWVHKIGAFVWVKRPLELDGAPDPDWDAYYRFTSDDGNPTLAEVRVLPR